MRLTTRAPRTRRGFTLVELLVVVAIIVVLVGLTAGGIFSVMDTQSKSNTEQAIRELTRFLNRQWQAVVQKASQENIPPAVQLLAADATTGAADPVRARVIWVKLRLAQEFPQTFAEVLAPPGGLPTIPAYVAALKKMGILNPPPANTAPQPYESAVCLLLALRNSRGGAAFTEDTLGSHMLSNKVVTYPYNPAGKQDIQVPLLQDAWGTPFAFFRYPTGNGELDGSNPAPQNTTAYKFRDPLDPQGRLLTPTWYWKDVNKKTPNPNRLVFEKTVHTVSAVPGNPTSGPQSYYTVPTIVSAGKNKRFGIDQDPQQGNQDLTLIPLTMKVTDENLEGDNLYSFRLRLNARGD